MKTKWDPQPNTVAKRHHVDIPPGFAHIARFFRRFCTGEYLNFTAADARFEVLLLRYDTRLEVPGLEQREFDTPRWIKFVYNLAYRSITDRPRFLAVCPPTSLVTRRFFYNLSSDRNPLTPCPPSSQLLQYLAAYELRTRI